MRLAISCEMVQGRTKRIKQEADSAKCEQLLNLGDRYIGIHYINLLNSFLFKCWYNKRGEDFKNILFANLLGILSQTMYQRKSFVRMKYRRASLWQVTHSKDPHSCPTPRWAIEEGLVEILSRRFVTF